MNVSGRFEWGRLVRRGADHRLAEYWHPLGPVGVITAFNFAVWA